MTKHKNSILNLDSILSEAEATFMCSDQLEVLIPVRRRGQRNDFYEALETELRQQNLLSVAEYRSVKEGWAKVSRPAVLRLRREDLWRSRPHLVQLQKELTEWRQKFIEVAIDAAISSAYHDLTADIALARSCLEVLLFLLRHRQEIDGLMPRQIQHQQSTKLIGHEPLLLRLFSIWRGESASWEQFYRFFCLVENPIEFRFFAPACVYDGSRLTVFHGLLAEDWIKKFIFPKDLSGTLIVENLQTFYSEASQSRSWLIIWGGGWKASALRRLHQNLPRPILYWGDIDKEGYEIYGHLKKNITDLQPTLMDHKSIARHEKLAIQKAPFLGPYRFAADLQAEYQRVSQRGLCIEQEKIHDRPYENI